MPEKLVSEKVIKCKLPLSGRRLVEILYQENDKDVADKIYKLELYFANKNKEDFDKQISEMEKRFNLKRQDQGSEVTGKIPAYTEKKNNRTVHLHYNDNIIYNFCGHACHYTVIDNKVISAEKLAPFMKLSETGKDIYAQQLDKRELADFSVQYQVNQNKLKASGCNVK